MFTIGTTLLAETVRREKDQIVTQKLFWEKKRLKDLSRKLGNQTILKAAISQY